MAGRKAGIGMIVQTMRIYLAARYARREELQTYQAKLLAAGFKCNCAWLRGNHQWNPIAQYAETTKVEYPPEARAFAEDDLRDLTAADTLMAFTDKPRRKVQESPTGGRHVEFGYALAMGKRVVVIGPRENVFYCLPRVERFNTFDSSVIDYLKRVPFHV